MATFLHRIGSFAARHPWRVVVAWLLLLGTLGASAAAFSQPLSTQFSLPGSDYERVLEDLERELPDAAGGSSTIVLVAEDGAFTREQQRAVADAVTAWEEQDAVLSVTDPFEVQAQLDQGAARLEEGAAQVTAGEERLEQARRELARGEQQLAAGEQQLAAYRQQQGADAPAVVGLAQRLEGLRAQLEQGRQELAAGEEQLSSRAAQLETGRELQQLSADTRFVSEDGTAAIAQIQFDQPLQSVSQHDRELVPEAGETLADAGIEVSYGQEITAESSVGGGIGEAAGLAVAVVVLIVVLGSLVVAGLPLVVALFGVGVGVASAIALTSVVELNSVTPTLAVMLGLAVGIDYSLFVINRHRQQLGEGMAVTESIALATGTAGNAVLVAGATVVIALSALLVTGVPLLVQMGAVAAGTVAVTVVAALTVSPALLAFVGTRATPRARRTAPGAAPGENGAWVRRVTRHPVLAIAGVVVVLGVAAIPATDLRLGLPDGGSEPAGSDAYTAYTTIEREFGAGVNGPLVAVASYDQAIAEEDVPAQQLAVGRRLAAADGADQVVPFGVSEDRRTLAFQVVPEEGPAAQSTVDLTHELTDLGDQMASEEPAVSVGVTGQTAANIEISERLADALPLYLVLVVGLSLLLLTGVFRSLVVPVLATAGFLLSVVASFGAVVAVYQWGWLGDLLGVTRPGAILSFMPILLIGVLFGLAMDYQMFLVSGMHEAHAHGEAARPAVVTGFRSGARIVTAAAIIMISVFGGFVFSEMTMVRPIGFGLAIGVLVDAFLVRMTLIPAAMYLLGERAWGLPRWLDRLIPDLDVEGTRLAAQRSQQEVRRPATTS